MPLPISQLPVLRSPFSGAAAHARQYLTRSASLVSAVDSTEQIPVSSLAVEYCARNEGSFVVLFEDIESHDTHVHESVSDISAAVGVIAGQMLKKFRHLGPR